MVDAAQITEHMEVVGSDGQHVGLVDNVGIKLTKKDPLAHGEHHYIKLDLVSAVQGDKLVLSVPAIEALEAQKAVEN